MATKTIGLSGRNYSTMALYASYVNALTLSAPEIAEVYNDGGAVADTTPVVISGWSGGSTTNTVTIRAATGHGWNANVNVQTNAFRFNAANGAALTNSVVSSTGYSFGDNVIVQGLQIRMAASTPANTGLGLQVGANFVLRQCILDSTSGTGALVTNGTGVLLENSLIHMRGTGYGVLDNHAGLSLIDMTIVSNGGGGTGVKAPYAQSPAPIARNVVVYGFTTDYQQTVQASSTNNATDKTVFGGTNWGTAGQVSVTSADFVSTTVGSEDWRPSGTSKLKNNGATVGPTLDAVGTARPQGASYDIGAWEVVTAASPPSATISYTEANDTSAITANVTISGVAGTISYTEANDTSAITANAASSTGTITTGAFKNNAGSALASLTGLTVTVLLASTLAFVKSFASQTTNSSGVMSITDPLLIAGTVYAVVTTNASGTLGVEKYTAA